MTSLLVMALSLQGVTGNGVERISLDHTIRTHLSERAQDKLQYFIEKNCQPILNQSSLVNTQLLQHEMNKVDQGIIDHTYTVSVQFINEVSRNSEKAHIRLTDYAGNNPSVDWVQIEEVNLSKNNICNLN